jgi:uncharacterized protein with von Willebrand factor type A (vWA) domain
VSPESEVVSAVRTVELDLPPLVGAFARRLHDAGLPVGPERAVSLARALALAPPIARRRLYFTARAVLVSEQSELRVFDAVFAEVFGARTGERDLDTPDASVAPAGAAVASAPGPAVDLESAAPADGFSATARPGAVDELDARALPVLASDEEVLRAKRFDTLEPDELAAVAKLMARLRIAPPTRLTRRARRDRHGRHIDLRRTLRDSHRTAGDPVRLTRRRRLEARRRLVMLCDISGSMEPYARAYLQFLTCAAGTGPNAEAFVFATRLTRLTRALAGRHPERAIQRAAAAAPDWSSGTRIGDALKAFNDTHGRRGMARGAVIVILSDGWERGEPILVGREMERLARLAHRIVWVNPRVSADEFSPQAGGMLAALPHCDALVSGHTLKALGEVADAIAVESWDRKQSPMMNYKPPAELADDEEEAWGSATPVAGSSFAMPSGSSPSRGNTTPGWASD